MPYGYLISTVLAASATAIALAPPHRPRRLADVGFRIGTVSNELPFLVFFLLLASTLLAAAQRDLGSPGGLAVLALALVTAAGLAVVVRRQLAAGPALEDALRDGLGPEWRASLAPEPAGGLRRRLPYARILLGVHVRRRDVERIADLRYGDDRRNRLDVYRHRFAPEGGPTLVYFHGGGYFSGRKNREARPLLYRLASQGWVCVSANYRLRPDAGFLDHLADAKKVIAWTREHGHEYGADPGTLVMAGSSAGAHLTSLCALTQNDPAYQPGFESADTAITAAVCLYGYFGDYYGHGEGSASSPLAHVRADAPPFLIVHGDADTLVPVREARRFAGALRSASDAPVVYAELPGGQHAFDLFHSLRFDRVVDAAECFAAWVRSRPNTGAPAEMGLRP
ncbi:alpha/beta hydrolase [Actinomadura latina]|uniref:Alpha/beta hydrolase n=1 Tax=Actinomadura latina TaxID=163603 RepID=A0A846Z427_9ACTN|nr:alpha/beta hydrolase [Actinomadura latina]NKZ06617.1 alpha/beta hydrolase [Actinomadura latina]